MGQQTAGNDPTLDPNAPPPPETQVVTGWRVACDGGEGALGHPRVWLQIPADLGWIDCGYCDKRFIHASRAEAGPVQDAEHGDLPGREEPIPR